MSSPEMIPASRLRGSSMLASSDTTSTRAFDALVLALERGLRHRVPKRAGSDRVALVLVGVQEALRGGPVDHLSQLPSQVHRILHAEAEALSTRRVVHVRRVAGQQDASRRGRPRPAVSCR